MQHTQDSCYGNRVIAGERKDIRLVKSTAPKIPKSLLLGTSLIQSKSR